MHTLDFSSPFWFFVPVAWIATWIVFIVFEQQKGAALVVSGIVYAVAAVVGAWLITLMPSLIS